MEYPLRGRIPGVRLEFIIKFITLNLNHNLILKLRFIYSLLVKCYQTVFAITSPAEHLVIKRTERRLRQFKNQRNDRRDNS